LITAQLTPSLVSAVGFVVYFFTVTLSPAGGCAVYKWDTKPVVQNSQISADGFTVDFTGIGCVTATPGWSRCVPSTV
jgi:hypothetical protein